MLVFHIRAAICHCRLLIIQYCRSCSHYSDILIKTKVLTQKLLLQQFLLPIWNRLWSFYPSCCVFWGVTGWSDRLYFSKADTNQDLATVEEQTPQMVPDPSVVLSSKLDLCLYDALACSEFKYSVVDVMTGLYRKWVLR